MKNYAHIVILVGVCGTGKSAVGQKVAKKLEVPFYDVDTFFATEDLPEGKLPQDVDLEKWLNSVEELIKTQADQKGCVISCSILQKDHRKRLTSHIDHQLDWVFMNDSYENVAQRVQNKDNHDQPISTLKSDFDTLEVPKRALTIDMTNSEQEILNTILKYLARKYG